VLPCTSGPTPLLDAQDSGQSERLAHNREPAGEVGPVERHRKEEAQGRDRAVDARRLHAALRLIQLEAAQILRCRRVRRAANEARKCPDVANVVVARLLAEAAHSHVLDHARTQRAGRAMHRMGGHQGLLSRAEGCWTFDARDRMPRSSCLSVHAITAARENPPALTPPSRESGFVHRRRTVNSTVGREWPLFAAALAA